jgi:ADP-heptose:LPS heptosyltransferase
MQHTPNILVIRRRYLGDIVLLGSLLRSLKAHWPAARVTALVEKPYGEILALNPDVDSVLALPARRLEWPGFLRRLRRAGFTHVIDIDNTEKTALVARASAACSRRSEALRTPMCWPWTTLPRFRALPPWPA